MLSWNMYFVLLRRDITLFEKVAWLCWTPVCIWEMDEKNLPFITDDQILMYLTLAEDITSVYQKNLPWKTFHKLLRFLLLISAKTTKRIKVKLHIFHDDSLQVLATDSMTLKNTIDWKHLECSVFNFSKDSCEEQVSRAECWTLLARYLFGV